MEKDLKAKRKHGKYGYVDEKNKWVIEPIYQVARDFKEGLAAIKIKDNWTFLKPNGSFLTTPFISITQHIQVFHNTYD